MEKAAVARVLKMDADSEEDHAGATLAAQRVDMVGLEPPKPEYGPSESGDETAKVEDALSDEDDDDDDDDCEALSVIEVEGALEEIGDESLSGGGESQCYCIVSMLLNPGPRYMHSPRGDCIQTATSRYWPSGVLRPDRGSRKDHGKEVVDGISRQASGRARGLR